MTDCTRCLREVELKSNGTRMAWQHVDEADHEPEVDDAGTRIAHRLAKRATIMLHALQLGGPAFMLPVIVEPVLKSAQELLAHYDQHPGTFPGVENALDPVTERILFKEFGGEVPDSVPEDWA